MTASVSGNQIHLPPFYPLKQMKNQTKAKFGVVFAASAIFLAAGTPAKAIIGPCADGTLAVIQAAGACTDTLGFTFQLNSFTNFDPLDRFSFQSSGNTFQYSIQGAAAWNPLGNTYLLDYIVTAPTGKEFTFFTSNLSSANDPTLDAGSFDISSVFQSPKSANSTFVPQLVANGGIASYSPALTTDTYNGALNVSGGTISSITGVIASQPIPSTSSVPGPLPLLGAVAGFRISRKIRNRIKAAA